MRGHQASATGQDSCAQPGAVEPASNGSTSMGSATRSRVVGCLAVGLGLLSVGLAVAAVVLRWPFADEGTLLEGVSETLLMTISVPYALMGMLICARQPWNRIGWLMVVTGLPNGAYVVVMYATHGREQLARLPVTWITGWCFWVPALLTFLFLVLLYPTGRLVSRRWRPVAWAAGAWGVLGVAAVVINPELADPAFWNPIDQRGLGGQAVTKAIQSDATLGSLIVLLALVLVVAVLASLVVRFRRARGVERQQLKWLVYGWSLSAAANTLIPLSWAAGILPWLVNWAIAVAIAVAILRYHLYDIDRLINRTLVYGLLTVVLGSGYAAIVLVLGQLFGGVTRDPPSWVVAGATLAMAAAFRPARRRIQTAVDRRFNRRRHDAARTMEAFTVRLRDHVDLETLSSELLAVVDQTMEPTTAFLWLRASGDAREDRPSLDTHSGRPT
jgi:hypothetical protein